jgi:predicted dehydrogenase/aryl-alcohol dehydrogenase-like predicted oxidoreductase
MSKIRWGILATGGITQALVAGIRDSETGELVAGASRRQASADAWGKTHDVERCHGSYEALFADEGVDAVYIASPNSEHARHVIQAAEAGKHILCEKPFASNYGEAMMAIEACRRNQVFLVEAFAWRSHPVAQRLVELIREGRIGQIKVIDAEFSFNLHGNPDNARMSNPLSGGGVMDVGCYTLSMVRLVAGAALGTHVAEPLELTAMGHVGGNDVDEWSVANARFKGDLMASMKAGVQCGMRNGIEIYGEKGKIHIDAPWFTDGVIRVEVEGEEPETISASSDKHLYSHEVDVLGTGVQAGRLEALPPAMTWADSLGQQKAVDRWRKALGVVFECESDEALKRPLKGRLPKPRADHGMSYGRIDGLEKPVSRIGLGSMAFSFQDMPYTCAMVDDFIERGGNLIDSAHVYGTKVEKGIGKWFELRGMRDDIVMLGKGAHTPHCYPDALTRELDETLDRLGTDHLDIYCMHRDNPEVPVGEFVDVLNAHVDAGRLKVFGGSNWSIERIEEANAYAKQHDRQGFSILNNNFSLALWEEPPWPACVTASDTASRAWFAKTRFPLIAWSSQASGFFTGRYGREHIGDESIGGVAPVYFTEDNFKRLDRARELGIKKGVDATQVALAYVLCQPLELYALIGPESLHETHTSMLGLNLELTPDEMAWLNLERESL